MGLRSTALSCMSAKPFLDTSVLIYLLVEDDPRAEVAESVLTAGGFISVQVLNEFAAVARRKFKLTFPQIEQALADIQVFCETPLPVNVEIHRAGLKIAARYGLQIYDSMMVAAAQECGCATMLSEDMQHGQKLGSLRIRNPFAAE